MTMNDNNRKTTIHYYCLLNDATIKTEKNKKCMKKQNCTMKRTERRTTAMLEVLKRHFDHPHLSAPFQSTPFNSSALFP